MKVLFILGPTAVGKSDLAVNLALKFGGEIISCDSVQVYKGLNIGSAKITKGEMKGVRHHLIDIKEPTESFTAFEYVNLLKEKINEITARAHLPIVTGGTSLYVKALLGGYNFGGEVESETRESLRKILDEQGKEKLFEMLKEKAPEISEKIDKNNPVRVLRALEIAMANGQKSSEKVDIDALIFAVVCDRKTLYDRINERVDIMLQNGLVDEVKGLKEAGVTASCQSMKAIGYKEVLSFLDGEVSFEEMSALIKQHSRNYAKRQLTFLRGMENVNYVERKDENAIVEKVEKWLK